LAKIKIYALLRPHERKLLEMLHEKAKWGGDTIWVGRMGRLGRESISLFVVYVLEPAKGSAPFVVKINKKREIQIEHRANRSMSGYLSKDVPSLRDPVFLEGRNLGALLYPHWGVGSSSTSEQKVRRSALMPRQLEQMIESMFMGESRYRDPEVLQCLGIVFDKLWNVHLHAKEKPVSLSKYQEYLREKKGNDVIKCVLGKNKVKLERPDFLGVQIYNPIKAFSRLPKRLPGLCKFGPAHGDLHPKNVILDETNYPHLIDFYWHRRYRHILVDYVLLENSIRFLLFPNFANLDDRKLVDTLLLKEDGYSEILADSFSSAKMKPAYKSLARMIQLIRKRARAQKAIVKDFTEYLISQFIVLYGLLDYPEYANCVTVRALGLIANKLEERGVIKSGTPN
jgi:hypothetical protein